MGTGIVSILLHNLPYNGRWLYWISVVVFCLNILLFIIFMTISMVRYIYFTGLFKAMLRHPVQSLFLGTVPMGLATIINMIVFVCVPLWGHWVTILAWSLWWFDAVLSVAICMSLPFLIMYKHGGELKTMTAAWLLPVVSPIVAAATGGIVAEVLTNNQHALWTMVISYIIWGMGFLLAMMVLVIYLHRLTMHNLPPREVIVSVFLPLGPVGQGSFALMQLGKVAAKILPKTGSLVPESGPIFYTLGFAIALVLWGFGLLWLFFALASISRARFPFNMGWWGFTFPLGVYTVATATLAKELPSLAFRVLATIFSICVTLLWIVVSVNTIRGASTGKLLFAPCAAKFEVEYTQRRIERAQKSLEMEPPKEKA
ncbi:putative C4-dicarboxylate transporter/malic acid transport protein, partial [Aureobasidium melanogenum]